LIPKPTTRTKSNFLQKPTKIIERILCASSKKGDIIADFFIGSGTTLAVAEKLNRRWIGCELDKVGIQIMRGRLVEQRANPFIIENIGNYQREMIYLSGGRIYEMQKIILKLYGAEPLANRKDLGVRKEGNTFELVYCGYPDRPVTARKVEELAHEARATSGSSFSRGITNTTMTSFWLLACAPRAKTSKPKS
jgi:hypothetical protein